jgi:uncharacterized ferritin-like protein (DUF455 family)
MNVDPRLFADPPARDARFEVRDLWSEMENIWDDDGRMLVEFLHRQMNEEVNGLEIAARNLSDFPDADWDLRLAIARQCWDEARHVEAFRRLFERRGGVVGEYPVLNFEYRMAMAISTLIGRLAVQNRSFEAAGIQAIQDALRRTTETDLRELLDAQLADEIQHVRYGNHWVAELVRRDPRQAIDVVRAVTQANEAFRMVAGDALVELTLDDDMRREVGLNATETTPGSGVP